MQIKVRSLLKNIVQIIIRVQAVFLSSFHNAINNGAGFSALWSIGKQPVFSADNKRFDAAFGTIV